MTPPPLRRGEVAAATAAEAAATTAAAAASAITTAPGLAGIGVRGDGAFFFFFGEEGDGDGTLAFFSGEFLAGEAPPRFLSGDRAMGAGRGGSVDVFESYPSRLLCVLRQGGCVRWVCVMCVCVMAREMAQISVQKKVI